jgi:hypothetical protein
LVHQHLVGDVYYVVADRRTAVQRSHDVKTSGFGLTVSGIKAIVRYMELAGIGNKCRDEILSLRIP